MTRGTRLLTVAGLLAAISGNMSCAENLKILTEESPPSSYMRNGVLTGSAVEVVQEIQRRVGDSNPIAILPWGRAYRQALKEPNIVLFEMSRTEGREHIFQWVGPLDRLEYNLYGIASSEVKLHSVEDAKKLPSIGLARDFEVDEILTKMGFANLDRSTTPDMALTKILHGRSAFIATDTEFIANAIKMNKLKLGDIRKLMNIVTCDTYIAFSKDTPSSIVESWRGALDSMKKDGTFARIYRKWRTDLTP